MRALLLSRMVALVALGCGPAFKADDPREGGGGSGGGGASGAAGGTGGGTGGTGGVSPDAVPDFQLIDVNPTSPRYDEAVSPRDYLEQVSAWYFGNAT